MWRTGPTGTCPSCVRRAAKERTEHWMELRRMGWDNRHIAEEEGVAAHVVAHALQRSRVARFGLEWIAAPYARGIR